MIMEIGASETDVILKSDQEPATKAVVEDVIKARNGLTTLAELSPMNSSGSNGKVERGVWDVEGYMRKMKSALEANLNFKVGATERIMTFLADYGAYLRNRLEIGKDGKTAYD